MSKNGFGIVRKVDELGRIVLPIEMRRKLGIDSDDGLEIFTEEDGRIVLKKYISLTEKLMNPIFTFLASMQEVLGGKLYLVSQSLEIVASYGGVAEDSRKGPTIFGAVELVLASNSWTSSYNNTIIAIPLNSNSLPNKFVVVLASTNESAIDPANAKLFSVSMKILNDLVNSPS